MKTPIPTDIVIDPKIPIDLLLEKIDSCCVSTPRDNLRLQESHSIPVSLWPLGGSCSDFESFKRCVQGLLLARQGHRCLTRFEALVLNWRHPRLQFVKPWATMEYAFAVPRDTLYQSPDRWLHGNVLYSAHAVSRLGTPLDLHIAVTPLTNVDLVDPFEPDEDLRIPHWIESLEPVSGTQSKVS